MDPKITINGLSINMYKRIIFPTIPFNGYDQAISQADVVRTWTGPPCSKSLYLRGTVKVGILEGFPFAWIRTRGFWLISIAITIAITIVITIVLTIWLVLLTSFNYLETYENHLGWLFHSQLMWKVSHKIPWLFQITTNQPYNPYSYKPLIKIESFYESGTYRLTRGSPGSP